MVAPVSDRQAVCECVFVCVGVVGGYSVFRVKVLFALICRIMLRLLSAHTRAQAVCVCVYVSACLFRCPPFVDSFVCMRVYNHGKARVCVFACAFRCCQRTSTRSSSGAEGSAVTGGWMKYLAVACFKKNNRCFVLLISTLARGSSFFPFFSLRCSDSSEWRRHLTQPS